MTDDEYRSDVRDGTIKALLDRVDKGGYPKYLRKIVMRRLRGFVQREVTFDFPVTALIGPNGGGKSTILGAAGLAYREVEPGRFFAKSGKYDASMKNWAIEFDLIDKSRSPQTGVQRTASFPELKWNRHALERQVLVFGVARTVPASERRDLARAASNRFTAEGEVALTPTVIAETGRILGRKIEGYNELYLDADGRVTMYDGQTPAGDRYSEFHFGAGEASVIRMVSEIEAADEAALILVEEIENGLHPVATRRMVEYLIEVARRKGAQVIFTTHSNDAIDPLPPKAIWAAYNGEVLQGKLDVNALRTITGQIDARLAVFVEDAFAEAMVTTALRYYKPSLDLETIKVHGMGGWSPAILVNEQHNLDPTSRFKSVCFVDGDNPQLANPAKSIYALPGDTYPEAHVFDRVMARLETVIAVLTVSMQLPPDQQGRVKRVVEQRAQSNLDRHLIYVQIGIDLDFTAETIVAGAFLAVWAQEYPNEVTATVENVFNHVPLDNLRRDRATETPPSPPEPEAPTIQTIAKGTLFDE